MQRIMNQSSFVDLSGRILLLSQSLDALRAQLAGNSLDARAAGPLRDDVSTDEITPVPILTHYDDRLGDYALTGFTVEGQRPIGAKLLRESDISILVGGKRYGKGSSREHSPAAERYAGIQLVIAESFERIYRQNADNIGRMPIISASSLRPISVWSIVSAPAMRSASRNSRVTATRCQRRCFGRAVCFDSDCVI